MCGNQQFGGGEEMCVHGILQQWGGQPLRGVRTPRGASHQHEDQASMADV